MELNLLLMSHEEKNKLILDLLRENQSLKDYIKEIESKPKKDSNNSSSPPSTDKKGNIEKIISKRKGSHNLGGRELSDNPDKVLDLKPIVCESCHHDLSLENFKLKYSFDKIELPKIKPIITRVHKYSCICSFCCKENQLDSSNETFSEQIKEILFYLHYEQYVSYERMTKFMKEVFSIDISEGSIANIFKSKVSSFKEEAKRILKELINSQVVCSDETSARVNGKTYWEWVFQNDEVCLHVIEDSRGSKVKESIFLDDYPEVWVSDQYSSQKKGIKGKWQVCLAHQLRDCQYAIDSGDNVFSPKIKDLFLRAIKSREFDSQEKKLKKDEFIAELEQYLELSIENIQGEFLQKRFERIKENLFVFLDYDNVPPTNNSSEQALRPSVIFRKVTNCFRSEWGKELFSYVRSAIGTAKRKGENSFQTFEQVFN
jgi:transposase